MWKTYLKISTILLLVLPLCQSFTEPTRSNNFPELEELPVNYFCWLGAHNVKPYYSKGQTVTHLLNDGIRKLNINICKRNKEISLCSYSENGKQHNISFQAFMDEVLDYVRQVFHQVIVIKVDSIVENPDHKITNFHEIEFDIDTVCRLQTGKTAGLDIDDYMPMNCPFIYVQPDHVKEWATLGEVMEHYEGYLSWEGDGEDDGIYSKIILVNGKSLPKHADNMPFYFSRAFSRNSFQPNQQPNDLKEKVHKLCKSPKPIALQAYYDKEFSESDNNDNDKFYDAEYIEDLIYSETGCNLNDAPKDTYFNAIEVDVYDKNTDMDYLKDLQKKMNKINHDKFLNIVRPKKEITDHDEL
ncbi:unnamed protein product [Cunninghamella blakesleeana]